MRDDDSQGPIGGRARGAHQRGPSAANGAFRSHETQRQRCGTAGTVASPEVLACLTATATAWLESRSLDPETASRIGIVSAIVPGGGDWIAIPIVRRGIAVNHKYRRIDRKDFRSDAGKPICWVNGDVIDEPSLSDAPLVVVEGEMDMLAAIQCGFHRTVSVPGGAPSTAGSEANAKYAFVAETIDALRSCREIILATDADNPGMNLMHDLAIRFGRGRCKHVVYPEGCNDLNHVLHRHGREAVVKVISTSRWCHVPGLHLMSELPPVPFAKPHDTMIAGLHDHYRIRKADFAVVTGIPGSGKSTIVNDIACRMAFHHGWNTCFASFEQYPQLDHRRALRTWHSRSLEKHMSSKEISEADRWIDKHFSFIIPQEDVDADLGWLLDKMAAAVIRHGADICVIDPWNEMDHARPVGQSLTEYVGWAIRQLKKFARQWNVYMVVVAHPAKLTRNKEGKFPVPALYDISDSAHWANKPDCGVIIHPTVTDEDGPYTRFIVAKSRYHDQIGKPGEAKLRFDASSSRFSWP